MKSIWKEILNLEQSGTPFVVVTLVETKGHAPQDEGAKALITKEGLVAGTVGGGKVEARCIEEAKNILNQFYEKNAAPRSGKAKIIHWNLQRDIGMTCGGEVTYLFESFFHRPWRILVFGAGHVGQSMAKILQNLECRATFIDSRKEWIERLPQAENIEKVCIPELPEVSALKNYWDIFQKEKDTRPYIVIMTQGHATDIPVLRSVFEQFPHAAYLGVIGSKVKGIKIKNEMKAAGYAENLIQRLRCPMGLPLGTNDPAEIAISIVAELIQIRDENLDVALPTSLPSVSETL